MRAVVRFRFIACIDLYSNTKLWWAFYLPPFEYFTKLGFFWQPRSEKRLPTCFVLSARTTKFFVLFCFLSRRMQTLPRARNVRRLNSQISHGTFVHYPFFLLNIPLCTFSYRIFFSRYLFVLTYFDSSRRHTHATTHAAGTQIGLTKMTSLDAIFCRGNKSSSRSLARFCRRKHKKSTARASRS